MWDAFSSGCNDGCDSAAARRTTPLAFGAADREDEPNSARKSSVTWRMWNESACYETVMSIEWQGSCIDTDLKLSAHQFVNVIEDKQRWLVPRCLVHPVLQVRADLGDGRGGIAADVDVECVWRPDHSTSHHIRWILCEDVTYRLECASRSASPSILHARARSCLRHSFLLRAVRGLQHGEHSGVIAR